MCDAAFAETHEIPDNFAKPEIEPALDVGWFFV